MPPARRLWATLALVLLNAGYRRLRQRAAFTLSYVATAYMAIRTTPRGRGRARKR